MGVQYGLLWIYMSITANNHNNGNASIRLTIAPGEDGMTARGALRRVKGVSQRLIRKILHGEGEGAGALYINDEIARFRDKVKAGDEVVLVLPEEESWIEPEDIPLTVLYEDEDILVINKQPGMVVHPTKGHRDGTVAGAIVFHMQKRGESYRPRFISRLDMDTSGVLLVGKNSHVQNNLARQGASDRVEKYYTAILNGRLEDVLPPSGVIDLPIGLAQPGEPQRTVLTEEEGGYPSRTEYETLRTVFLEGRRLTVVRARLITGRTHQIRVHFAHYGIPVLGDHLYGSPTPLISRQALHAAEIAFEHPVTANKMRFEAPLPEDIAAFISSNMV